MKKYFPVFFYLLYSVIIFLPILTSQGIPMGGDWSQPYGKIQTMVHYEYFSNAWNELTAIGARNMALGFFPIALFMKILFFLGASTITYSKYLLPLITTFAGCSLYSLLRYLKINKQVALIGGFVYITSPIFFNYSILGWVYILFFISALLPLAAKNFLIAINEKSTKHLIITAIIFSIASIQAQAVIIFPFVFIILGLVGSKNFDDLKYLIKSLSVILLIFFLLTAYWLPGMLLFPEQSVSGSDIVGSSVSIGTSENLNPVNIIRLFGSLYNFQFETIINHSRLLMATSFILPLLALCSLLVKKHRRWVISFWLIGLIPLLLYFLSQNRQLLMHIPYANVFRDFSRFATLSTFSYAVLSSIFLEALIKKRQLFYKFLFGGLISIWLIFVSPWWRGELTNWAHGQGRDVRLRTFVVNQDYLDLEKYLASVDPNYKALYIPTGGYISFPRNEKFYGEYKEMQDIFSQFSPISGSITLNDRNTEEYFVNRLNSNLTGDLIDILRPVNYKYIILRKDAAISDKDIIVRNLNNSVKSGDIKITSDNATITLYELTSPSTLINSPTSAVEFSKKNSSKYSIVIKGANDPFLLFFNESFHPQWKLFRDNKNILTALLHSPVVEETSHFVVNGFANGWSIDPATICANSKSCKKNSDGTYDIYLNLEFIPQRVLYFGLVFSITALLGCLWYIVRHKRS